MDPNKLRKLLFEKDKQNPQTAMNPTLGSHLPGNGSMTIPQNKSAPKPMSPGLPNPMGMHQGMAPASPIKMNLSNPTGAPSIIGKPAKLPKDPKFAKTKNFFKKGM